MKKYLGIVKIATRVMTGIDLKILTKFSSNKKQIEKWLRLYPNSESLVLLNNEDLEKFFEEFEDVTPITEKEKKDSEKEKNIKERLNKLIIKYRYFCSECPNMYDFSCSGADAERCQKEKDKLAAEIKKLKSKLK